MTDHETAARGFRQPAAWAAVAGGLVQCCALIARSLRPTRCTALSTARDAGDRRHVKAMRALEVLIERPAPGVCA